MDWLYTINTSYILGGIMNKEQLKALLASYGRSVLAAATTLYMAGVTDPIDLAYSLVGAIIPVALRYVNPSDKAFGRIPTVADVEVALKTAKPVKRAAKKTTAK
jgi:hypothetical protein